MSLLDQLGHLHGTDKASGSHDYLDWYDIFLAPLRERPIRVFEMGVGGGGSLRMWRDYFPLSEVVGLDIQEDRRQFGRHRITIETGDQANDSILRDIVAKRGPFDLIVDDAGHQASAQLSAYKALIPQLNAGGVYILEDIGDQAVVDYLMELAKGVVRGSGDQQIKSLSFYRETSVTVMK